MVKIGYIVGSLAADSLNRKLAGVLVAQAPEGVRDTVEVPIAELPLYDRHLDEDFPQVLTDFKAQVDDVDALLLVTPEHNQSYPAPVKNAIDILTRGGSSELKGLKMGLVGASPLWHHQLASPAAPVPADAGRAPVIGFTDPGGQRRQGHLRRRRRGRPHHHQSRKEVYGGLRQLRGGLSSPLRTGLTGRAG